MDTEEAAGTVETGQDAQQALGSFVDYRRAVLDLARDLSTLESHANANGLFEAGRDIQAVLQRMQEERFNIVVVGEFNRGKSTLINALLGVHVAPMHVLACTAVLTRVTYGIDKRAVVGYKDGREETIAYDALPDFITKLTTQSAAVAAGVERATVHYPSPYCLNNVDVIDTPGLNEDAAMTAVTLTALPHADAAIMVIMAESPFGQYERDFLETRLLSADLGRVIFVVNGIDRMESPEQVQRVLAGVRKRITDHVIDRARRQWGDGSTEFEACIRKIGEPRIFGLSARQAFRAKTQMDMALLGRSGFPAFEAHLQHLLTEQRGVMMLHPPINRALTASRDVLDAMRTREAALSMSDEEFNGRIRQADELVEAAKARWAREMATLERTRETIREAAKRESADFVAALQDAVAADIAAMTITADQLKKRKELNREIEGAAGRAISRTVDKYNERLRDTVAAILSDEEQRLRQADQELASLMAELRRLFVDLELAESLDTGDSIALVVSIWTGFGGIFSGYRSAGLKGAAVGLGASFGTAVISFAALAALGVASLTSLPILLGIGLLSWKLGGTTSDWVFKESRVERYKKEVTKSALKNLQRHIHPADVAERFAQAAMGTFEAFKKAAEQGAAAVLGDASNHVNGLTVEHARQRTATDHERAAAVAARGEVEAIQRRTQVLAGKLMRRDAIPSTNEREAA